MLKWIRQGVNRFPLLSNVRGQNTFMPKLGHRGSTGHRWQVRSPRDGKSTSEIWFVLGGFIGIESHESHKNHCDMCISICIHLTSCSCDLGTWGIYINSLLNISKTRWLVHDNPTRWEKHASNIRSTVFPELLPHVISLGPQVPSQAKSCSGCLVMNFRYSETSEFPSHHEILKEPCFKARAAQGSAFTWITFMPSIYIYIFIDMYIKTYIERDMFDCLNSKCKNRPSCSCAACIYYIGHCGSIVLTLARDPC